MVAPLAGEGKRSLILGALSVMLPGVCLGYPLRCDYECAGNAAR